MKFKFHHPEPSEGDLVGPRYWKSLDDLAETPGFKTWVEREFPEGAAELESTNRRSFLKIMAASFALGGLGVTGCRRPEQKILPYAKQPENMIPGVAQYFASSRPTATDNIPLIVETHQARPTKLEGNPTYLPYAGSTDVWTQASVLDMYDPDRTRKSTVDGSVISPAALEDWFLGVQKEMAAAKGAGFAILAEPSTSPTRAKLIQRLLKKNPQAIVAEYNPLDAGTVSAAVQVYCGKKARPLYDFSAAKCVLSLEDDFLNVSEGALGSTCGFSKARKVDGKDDVKKMNRLYAVESDMSLTGGMADHRLRASTGHIPALTALIAAEILSLAGASADLAAFLKSQGSSLEVDPKWIRECAKDLWAHKGKAVLTAGSHLPEEVHLLVFAINGVLGAEKKIVRYVALPENPALSLSDLVAKVEAGAVKNLLILGGNPVYNAPADVDWTAIRAKVATIWRHSIAADETSAIADAHIAGSHFLEYWGDGRTWDGTVVPVQPTIEPLFETLSETQLLARLIAGESKDDYAQVQETFASLTSASNVAARFNQFLTEGVIADSAFKGIVPALQLAALAKYLSADSLKAVAASKDALEFRLKPSLSVLDGRFNNNGWMQELPDAMTKIAWDNAICVSPKLAGEIGVLPQKGALGQFSDKMTGLAASANEFEVGKEKAKWAVLSVDGRTVEGPVHVQPGLADYTVVVTLGYGRSTVGTVGTGTGFNAYPLMTTKNRFYVGGGSLTVKEGADYFLANTQEHWSMEGRAIIREANASYYAKNNDFASEMGMESHTPPNYGPAQDLSIQEKVTTQPRGLSAYETPQFRHTTGAKDVPQQWGMVIDLNTCTGCNACVVACQSENNIPIVGKDQVLRGREMHWNRLDRYYSSGVNGGDVPEDPQVSFMGVACMHCEMAPCESVCPVNATVHDEQGLNTMAYNRCVGTRYCANNCPYKVRRFNFFDWNKRQIGEFYKGVLGPAGTAETLQMQKNPDVTVRMRGVMEKCTYCVQRIEGAKIKQKVRAADSNDINVRDGAVKTACQQVCPAAAISFGDLSDASTEVSKAYENDRNYSVLGYLNLRPRTTYLAKLRNPNPAMPDYAKMPLSTIEYKSKKKKDKKKAKGDSYSDSGHNSSSTNILERFKDDPKAPIPLKPLNIS